MDIHRPQLHALVGWYEEPFGLIRSKIVSLEVAVDYQKFGAWVLIDPDDEQQLATYERQQRSYAPTRRLQRTT